MRNTAFQSPGGLNTLRLYNVAFVVSDMEQAMQWYRRVLGFEQILLETFPTADGPIQMAFMEGAGLKLELLQGPGNRHLAELATASSASGPLTIIGTKALVFQVDNLRAASEELAQQQVTFLWRERYMADGRLFCSMFLDPDGNRINIFQADTVV